MERKKQQMKQEDVTVATTAAAMLLLGSYLSLGIFMIYKIIELSIK